MSRPKYPSDLAVNSERMWQNFVELSGIGATSSGGVSRVAFSFEDTEARHWFASQVEEAGLVVVDDDAANLSGVFRCPAANAPTLIVGSHLDSVPNGGKYDGAIGILAALECARTLQAAGIQLPFHLEVMNFTDEEGTWVSLFGSRALAGSLTPEMLEDATPEQDMFRVVLMHAGISSDRIERAQRDPASVAAYLELHVEQGINLDRENRHIGIVQAIVGRSTYQFSFHGATGHSGTTDVYQRRDALQGASLFIHDVYPMVQERFPGGLVNCAKISNTPGRFNMIPARADLVVECRHEDSDTLSKLEEELVRLAQQCAARHRLTLDFKRTEHMPAAKMNPVIVATIQGVCDQFGITSMPLVSYAGHDAQAMSWFCPSGLIFIPSVDGISQSAAEFSRWEDVITGSNVLLHTILALAEAYDAQ